MDFCHTIIRWYSRNKRDFPWRETSDPYRIWVSEIILQQTRVNQGLPYYLRFIQAFPTLVSLAKANEDRVLKLWQGLGYYSRAKNLHKTAKIIVAEHNARFPSEFKEIIRLPGIGEYTAGAILSFAFNKPYPVVDGNVFRILSRYLGIRTPINSQKGKKEFFSLAAKLLDRKQPGLFNQAIMEMGAVQCVPENPDCFNCCLKNGCFAFTHKSVEAFPVKQLQRVIKKRYFNFLFISDGSRLAIRKRTGNDIWNGLYELPLIELNKCVTFQRLKKSTAFKSIIPFRNRMAVGKPLRINHPLTHQLLCSDFWKIQITKPSMEKLKPEFKLVKFHQLKKYPVPRLIEKYFEIQRVG